MTTKRLTPVKYRADDVRAETLDQFSRSVDAFMGTPVGFADHVHSLYLVRADLGALRAARKAANDLIKDHYVRGETRAVLPGDGAWEVRRTEPTPVTVVRAVPSEVVKKASKALWEAAKIPKTFVQVKAHPRLPAVESRLQLPRLPERGGLAALITHLQDLPKLSDLQTAETDHLTALDKIGANAGWDGLPIEFADRWLVGLRRLQYDSDRLREVDPAAWDRLAVAKPHGGVSRTYLARLDAGGPGEEDGLADLDGE